MNGLTILGLDPGLSLGWALLRGDNLLGYGTFRADRNLPRDRREQQYGQLAALAGRLLDEKRPGLVAIEEPYTPTWARGKELNRRAREALQLSKLVILLVAEAARRGLETVMVKPEDGFRALTGSPRNDKRLRRKMVKGRFACAGPDPPNEHETSAVGVALRAQAEAAHEKAKER